MLKFLANLVALVTGAIVVNYLSIRKKWDYIIYYAIMAALVLFMAEPLGAVNRGSLAG